MWPYKVGSLDNWCIPPGHAPHSPFQNKVRKEVSLSRLCEGGNANGCDKHTREGFNSKGPPERRLEPGRGGQQLSGAPTRQDAPPNGLRSPTCFDYCSLSLSLSLSLSSSSSFFWGGKHNKLRQPLAGLSSFFGDPVSLSWRVWIAGLGIEPPGSGGG